MGSGLRTGVLAFGLGQAFTNIGGCSDSSGAEDNTSVEEGVGLTSVASEEASAAGAENSESGASSGPKLDSPVGEVGDGTGSSDSCAKVDLLFVIDNSGSMADEQAKLIANFPGFANEIQSTLAGVDSYHVGVTVTDNFGLPFPDGINADAPECRTLGALVTSNVNGSCAPFAEGQRFMTQADDLSTAFACAANVGDTGSGFEQVAGSMIAAIQPAINAPGACNEGFIRDDALLVIVLISDENDDIESQGDPPDWFQLVSTLKFNRPDNVVVLSLLWDDSDGNPFGCQVSSEEEFGSAVAAFTNTFLNGSVGNICANSYQQFFSDAISVIDSACDGFMPPG